MGFSPFAYFYWSGGAFTLVIGTWLWLKILDIRPTSTCDVFLSFIYNLFPSFAWPLTLPLTIMAFLFIKFPNLNLFCRYRSRDNDENSSHAIEKMNFKLDTSNLLARDTTTEEVEQIEKHSDNSKCAICLEVIRLQTKESKIKPRYKDFTLTRCDHVFHFICIRNWILKDKSCPVCREFQMIECLRFFYKRQPPSFKVDKIKQIKTVTCDVSEDVKDKNKRNFSHIMIQTVEFRNYHSKEDVVIRVDLLNLDLA